jgi:hypothetical protein
VKRLKRDYISLADLESEKPLTREKRLQLNIYEDVSNAIDGNDGAVHKLRIFNDELWDQEWYLVIIDYNICIFSCNYSKHNASLSDYAIEIRSQTILK